MIRATTGAEPAPLRCAGRRGLRLALAVFPTAVTFVAVAGFAAGGVSATAQEPATAPAETFYLPARSLQPVRVVLPPDFVAERPAPLVLALHGYGGSNTTFDFLAPRFQERGLILAVAQAPYVFVHEAGLGFDWQARRGASADEVAEATRMSVDYVREIIRQLRRRYRVNDVYLLGFSQGGSMAYRVGVGDPDVRGIMVFGASFRPEWLAPEALAETQGLRVFIGHGRGDRVAITNATTARDLLRQSGCEVMFRSFAGGHEIPPATAAEALDWIITPEHGPAR